MAESCPYCERRMGRPRLREHLALNVCGLCPSGAFLAFNTEEIKSTPERELLHTITIVATELGWRWFHVERSRAGVDGRWYTATTGAPGVPDLWLVRDGVLVVLELKRWKGRARDGQADWIEALDVVPGVTARMSVTPADWPQVQLMLTRKPE